MVRSSCRSFNGHYDNWCYLPVLGFVSFNEEAEQYLCAAVLRPGNVTAAGVQWGYWRRLVRIIVNRFPGVQIRVRLDGGFAHPAVLEFLDAQPKLEYVVAMAKNAVLKAGRCPGNSPRPSALSKQREDGTHLWRSPLCGSEVARSTPRRDQSRGRPSSRKRSKDNPALFITNMKQSPQWITNRFIAGAATSRIA